MKPLKINQIALTNEGGVAIKMIILNLVIFLQKGRRNGIIKLFFGIFVLYGEFGGCYLSKFIKISN